jgi:hypothetical protein
MASYLTARSIAALRNLLRRQRFVPAAIIYRDQQTKILRRGGI